MKIATMATTILIMLPFPGLPNGGGIAQAQGFNCRAADSFQELRICDSRRLSRLDGRLNAVYQDALDRADNPRRLRARQRAWLAARSRCGASWSCLEGMYRDRIAELRRY